MAQQHRVYPRKRGTFRVDYVDPYGRVWWGVASDLSRSGMFLKSSGLSLGDDLVLSFPLPTGRPCKIRAQVMRTTQEGVGLHFTSHDAHLEAYFSTFDLHERWCEASIYRREGGQPLVYG
jgi:hypothetical protein